MHAGRITTMTVVAAGLLLVACGDDTQALTKPEFVEQANAICQVSNDEATPIFDAVWEDLVAADFDFDDPANRIVFWERFDVAIDEIVPIFDRQLAEIRALEPPTDDKELLQTLFDDQDAALDEYAALVDDAVAGDEAAMAALDSDEDPFTDIDRRARDYGLTVCGEEDE